LIGTKEMLGRLMTRRLGACFAAGTVGVITTSVTYANSIDWRPLKSLPGSENSALTSTGYPLVKRRGANNYSLEQVAVPPPYLIT